MHTEKFNSNSLKAMIHHYLRDLEGTLKRSNIDRSRTHLNYEIGNRKKDDLINDIDLLKEQIKKETGRAVRKDAVLLADICLTLPTNIPEKDEKKFFELSAKKLHEMLVERGLSSEAIVKGFIHKDEATPHMHFAFTPVKKNNNDKLSFSFKTIVKREFYRCYHEELQDFLTKELGYTPKLLREEDDTLKSLSKLDQEEYKKVKDKMKSDAEQHKKNIKQLSEQEMKIKQVLAEKKVKLAQLKAKLKTQKTSSELLTELNKLKQESQNLETAFQML